MSIPTSNSQVWLKREVMDLQPVVRTSRPYPVMENEGIALSPVALVQVLFREFPNDLPEIQLSPVSLLTGNFKAIVRAYDSGRDDLSLSSPALVGGVFSMERSFEAYSVVPEEIQLNSPVLLSGDLRRLVVFVAYTVFDEQNNYVQLSSISLIGATLDRV